MANLVIKPASGSTNKLIFQNQAGTVDAITVEDSGAIAIPGNTTLSGTANNLGTVTGGTLGSAVTMPDRVLFDYQIVSSKGRYTFNQSGTNAGLGGFTGTLKYSSEIHVIKINAYRGGTNSNGPQDGENFGVSLLSSATPSHSNGSPTSNTLPAFCKVNNDRDVAYWDVPIAFSNGSHGDQYHFYNHYIMTHATVTGTAGVTTYAYYAWFFNPSAANAYVGGSKTDSTRGPTTYVELMKYTV